MKVEVITEKEFILAAFIVTVLFVIYTTAALTLSLFSTTSVICVYVRGTNEH